MVNFGEILSRAWNIIWRYKILWLFGLFASLGGGGGNGGANYNFNLNNRSLSGNNFQNFPVWIQNLIDRIGPLLILGFLVLGLLLIVVLIVLNTFGKIGLARGAWVADEGAGRLTFAQLWQMGAHYFWRVLLLILLIWALTLALALMVILPSIGLAVLTLGVGLLCLVPLLCVLAIVLWAISVMADLAVIAIVNEDLGVIDAVSRAWAVFTSRPADFIVMAFILWIGGLVAGLIIGLPVVIIMAPLIASLIFQSQTALTGSAIVSALLFLIYLPVLLLANAILQAYINTAWTLLFRRVTGRQPGVSSPQGMSAVPGPNL